MISNRLVFPFVLLLLLCVPLAAQTGNGTISGTVKDATGAVVPQAKATLTNTATGVVAQVEASPVGVYYFGSVRPGPYTLTIEAPGFKKYSGTLTMAVGQSIVIDPPMEVGSVDTTVEVTGAAPVIETEGAQVSDVKDQLRIRQLPLNGRVVTNLFDLTPGVEGGSSGSPRVNGMKVGSAEMLLDGISMVDRFGGGISRVQPGLDTIQEYRVETAGSNAQYSRPATMSIVTKSGTNDFHGAMFETHRNNFGGLRARQRQDGNSVSQYIRNEYGFSAGGPVLIPKLYNGKNKTFWFFSYEGQKERQAQYAETQAPTDAIWNGNFTGMTDVDGNARTIYNPLTTNAQGLRSPFPNNVIPTTMIKPVAATMKSISALPNYNLSGNPWTDINYRAYYPVPLNIQTYTAKIDEVISEKDNLSGRFTRSTRDRTVTGGQYGYPPLGVNNAGGTGRTNSGMTSAFVRWNHVFTPTFLNEFQASGHRSPHSQGTLGDNTNWADKLGFPNPFGVTGWPTICTDSPFFYWGCWDGDNRNDQNLTAFQIEDNVTWIKGKHTVKAGFKGRQEYNNVRELQQAQGSHGFYGDWTALYDPASEQAVSYTGSGFASMLLGNPTSLSNQYNRGYFYFQQKELGAYVQDTWRVSSNLTLDIGLRWDKWTVYKEKYNRLVNLDITKASTGMEVVTPYNTRVEDIPGIPVGVVNNWKARGMTWKTADSIGFPSGLLPADNNNFAPRLGLAYRLNNKTVIRGGYGIYYWTMPLSQILQSSRSNPPLNLRFTNDLASRNTLDPNHALRYAPIATDYLGAAQVDITGTVSLNGSQGMMPWDIHNWSDNMAQNWTFTVERELMKETSVRLSYIGNHGSNLEQRIRWNDPESEYNYQARTGLIRPANADLRRVNPNWTGGCCSSPVSHIGYSNTSTFQAELERRYSNGLAFQWFYSFTHAMTTTDTGGFSFGSSGINSSASGSAYAVPENILIMGNPNLSLDQRLRLGYANSTEVPSHRVRWNGLYELPFGKGKRFGGDVSKAVNHVIGGWQLAFIGSWNSGRWMGVNAGKYLFGDPQIDASQRLTMNIFGKQQRLWFKGDFDPSGATGVDMSKLTALVPVNANRSQRVLRPVGQNYDNRVDQRLADGTVRPTSITDMLNWNARNFMRGDGAFSQDASLFKYIHFNERMRLRLTGDFFNVLNHPINLQPDSGTGLQDLSRQANDPRIIQLSARFEW